MPNHYIALMFAVIFETIGTTALNATEQFTRPLPTALMVVTYLISFYLMAVTMRVMPVGLVYALWSGSGIVLIAVAGYLVFGQKLDIAALLGMALIVAGVLVINLFSGSTTH
ncbi:MAG: QacE family quaternary ammonium compound efflux SMR transporter [Rhodobacteraceae bacterium]|nr:QacE family quaternary ammonium compound efflux SMR transporter [Paracoccaceae bacterium]